MKIFESNICTKRLSINIIWYQRYRYGNWNKNFNFRSSISWKICCFSCITKFRYSSSQVFFKTGVFKSFAIFKRKWLCWNLFLLKLQAFVPATLLKRDSNKIAFPGLLQHFQGHLFLQIISAMFSSKASILAAVTKLRFYKRWYY